MHIGLGLYIGFLSITMIFLEGLIAYKSSMLTPSQMLRKHPDYLRGLPFIAHGGMWGDLILITPLVMYIVANFVDQWTILQWLLMYVIGSLISLVMHVMYVQTPFPDSLAWKGGLSGAGVLHVVYMALMLSFVGMFYFYTTGASHDMVAVVSVVLAMHVAVGNHIVLGAFNRILHFSWCPEFIAKPDPWVTIGAVCAILGALAWWVTNDWMMFIYLGMAFAWAAAIPLVVVEMSELLESSGS